MSIDAAQLLRKLEPAVRPGIAVPAATGTARHPLEAQGFASLLNMASRGELASGQDVRDARTFGSPELTDAQLLRLSAAGDRAETAGAKRAAVLLDDRVLVMNVPSREIVQELTAGSAGDSLAHVDAVLRADAQEHAGTAPLTARAALEHLGRTALDRSSLPI